MPKERERTPRPADIPRGQVDPVPHGVNPCILRKGREENVAAHPVCSLGRWPKRGAFLDEREGDKVPRHEEQVSDHPFQWIVVEEQEAWDCEVRNALDHGPVGGIQHSGAERMGLTLQLEGLGTDRAEKVHDLRAGLCAIECLRTAGRAIEVLGHPGLRHRARRLGSTCVGRRKRGVHGEAHSSSKAMT